ncbi:MAG: TerB family tellurite resistance protein [Granulosicoccus sp.]
MFTQLIDRIALAMDPNEGGDVAKLDIQRVTAMLLVEIARADHEVGKDELQAIRHALSSASDLADTEIDAILQEAVDESESSVSLHEHVSVINEQFDKANKVALIEQMWRVAAANGDIDQYEEYTIRKLCDLLFVKHRDFMQAKLRVLGDQ